jgi:hypothetical protein
MNQIVLIPEMCASVKYIPSHMFLSVNESGGATTLKDPGRADIESCEEAALNVFLRFEVSE